MNFLLKEHTCTAWMDVTITSHHLFKSRVHPNPSCHWMHNAESVRIISTFHIDNKFKKPHVKKNQKIPTPIEQAKREEAPFACALDSW